MTAKASDDEELPTDLPRKRADLSRPHVVVVWEGGSLTRPVAAGESLTIGRAKDSDVVVNHPSVSRKHALLLLGPPSSIEDLGSASGVRIGDVVLRAERAVLEPGQAVAIGAAVLIVHGSLESAPKNAVAAAHARTGEAGPLGDEPIVNDPETRRVHETIALVADSMIPILLQGDTGVGKDVLAETIHRRSARASRPFVRVNCAAMPTGLLESELFGHERGAFTGAAQAKAGLVESADGGTMFLDEIGEMDPSMQSKLLHVLERGEVMRVGSLRPRPVDVRFVAATNRDLEKLVASGAFRKDLYFRLKGVSLLLPPLAARVGEIAPLAALFLDRACSRLNRPPLTIAPAAMECLERYPWPGNVRELRHVIERAAVMCKGQTVQVAHLPAECALPAPPPSPAPSTRDGEARAPRTPEHMRDEAKRAARSVEREHIIDALERCAGNQSKAARLLGVSRRTLVARLTEYRIGRPRKDGES